MFEYRSDIINAQLITMENAGRGIHRHNLHTIIRGMERDSSTRERKWRARSLWSIATTSTWVASGCFGPAWMTVRWSCCRTTILRIRFV